MACGKPCPGGEHPGLIDIRPVQPLLSSFLVSKAYQGCKYGFWAPLKHRIQATPGQAMSPLHSPTQRGSLSGSPEDTCSPSSLPSVMGGARGELWMLSNFLTLVAP